MKIFVAAAFAAFLAHADLTAATNAPGATNVVATASGTNDPVAAEFRAIMLKDEEATDEIDRWIQENEKFAKEGAAVPARELNQRIRQRISSVRAEYEDFIKRHPDHVEARLAIASLLEDIHDEEAVFEHLDKARQLAPTNSAVWNNLANYHGHTGDPKLAFDYYARAIELNPTESVYYHNFGTTVYLFRKDAREHYHITENEVFEKALNLYSNAMRCDPTNFALAADVAKTYYGIRPMRFDAALASWTNTLAVAGNQLERDEVSIHFARIKTIAGRFDEARVHLDGVTDPAYAELKERLERNLAEKIAEAATNSPATNGPSAKESTPAPGENK